MHLFNPEKSIGPWVNTIAIRVCIDLVRNAKLRPELPILDLLLDVYENPFDRKSGRKERTPAEILIGHEEIDANRKLYQRFLKSLEFLKPGYAELVCRVFGLAGFKRQSYKEVSTALKIPVGTVKSRLHAAKNAIARMLILRKV